jgi:hypothetical protein
MEIRKSSGSVFRINASEMRDGENRHFDKPEIDI